MSLVKKCNKCGREFGMYDYQERISLDHYAGYGSRHDGDKVHIDLCIECFDSLVDSCILDPIAPEGFL